MLELFFDTETTGFALFDKPPTDPAQPHLLELGAALYDGDRLRQQISLIIKPRQIAHPRPGLDFTVPKAASDVHGITDKEAMAIGVHGVDVLKIFSCMVADADRVVCHNLKFDVLIMKAFGARYQTDFRWPQDMQCTMERATPIMGLRGASGRPKWPKLAEAHQHFCGTGFEGAHTALADALACRNVWRAMQPAEAPKAGPAADEIPM